MPRQLLHAVACGVVAWLALTAPASARRYPANPPSMEALSLTLAGPCATFSWHNPDERRVTAFDLTDAGLDARHPTWTQRPGTITCPSAQPWSLGVGALYGTRIADERADYFIAGGYRVQLGAWRIGVGAGVVYEPLLTRRNRAVTTVHVGDWFPYFMVQAGVRW